MSTIAATRGQEAKVLGLIGTGHFMSHFYFLALPVLITFLAKDYGFSPTQLGFFLAAFTSSAAIAQMPVGLLVDRVGARAILTGGLVLEAASIGAMAFTASYPLLLTLAVLGGLGHSVFHPTDYAIMTSSVSDHRIGRAFSLHTVTGNAGSALAPTLIAYLALLWHWKIALLIAAAFGIVTALAIANQSHVLQDGVGESSDTPDRPNNGEGLPLKTNLRMLMTPSVLILFSFFLVTTMATSGLQSFSIFALAALHGVPQTVASTALTGFLVASAVGVLAGGWIADVMPRHDLIASVAFLFTAAALVLIGQVNLDAVLLITVFAAIGILQGMVKPARDMMVRDAMPPGTAGTIYAFMSTGRLVGSAITPILIGWLIAHGSVDMVFLILAVFALLGLATLYMPRGAQPAADRRPSA